MKTITIRLRDDLAAWARAQAAQRSISVSKLIGEFLTERMRSESDYEAAMNDFFTRSAQQLRKTEVPYPKRHLLYER